MHLWSWTTLNCSGLLVKLARSYSPSVGSSGLTWWRIPWIVRRIKSFAFIVVNRQRLIQHYLVFHCCVNSITLYLKLSILFKNFVLFPFSRPHFHSVTFHCAFLLQYSTRTTALTFSWKYFPTQPYSASSPFLISPSPRGSHSCLTGKREELACYLLAQKTSWSLLWACHHCCDNITEQTVLNPRTSTIRTLTLRL